MYAAKGDAIIISADTDSSDEFYWGTIISQSINVTEASGGGGGGGGTESYTIGSGTNNV